MLLDRSLGHEVVTRSRVRHARGHVVSGPAGNSLNRGFAPAVPRQFVETVREPFGEVRQRRLSFADIQVTLPHVTAIRVRCLQLFPSNASLVSCSPASRCSYVASLGSPLPPLLCMVKHIAENGLKRPKHPQIEWKHATNGRLRSLNNPSEPLQPTWQGSRIRATGGIEDPVRR